MKSRRHVESFLSCRFRLPVPGVAEDLPAAGNARTPGHPCLRHHRTSVGCISLTGRIEIWTLKNRFTVPGALADLAYCLTRLGRLASSRLGHHGLARSPTIVIRATVQPTHLVMWDKVGEPAVCFGEMNPARSPDLRKNVDTFVLDGQDLGAAGLHLNNNNLYHQERPVSLAWAHRTLAWWHCRMSTRPST